MRHDRKPILNAPIIKYRGVATRTHVRTCFHIIKATTQCPLQTVAKGCPDMFIAFGNESDVMMYAMSIYKQAFIVHRRTVGGAQLQGMMETSTHH